MQTPTFADERLDPIWARVAPRLARPSVVHGSDHVLRVVGLADRLARAEGADRLIVGAAALLHDACRDGHDRDHAEAAAELAGEWLPELGWDDASVRAVQDAIAAHRFSGAQDAPSLEAQCLQDADRLDAIGAIGLLRCFAFGGDAGRRAYHPADPLGREAGRPLDDRAFTVDHLHRKLLRLADGMGTDSGRALAARRHAYLEGYLTQLAAELGESEPVTERP